MNIGIFTDTYSPQINGVVTSVRMLEKELNALGHKVFIITTSDPKAKTRHPRVFRMPSMPFVFLPTHRVAMLYSPKLLLSIKKLDLDIIHTQSEFPVGIFGKIVSEFYKIPMVHTYHTMYEDYVHYIARGHLITPKMAQKYSRIFCNRAKVVIAPVEKAKNSLINYGVKRPIKVIPTGLDFSPFSRENYSESELLREKESLGIKPDEPVIVYCGRVAKEKSIDVIVGQIPGLLEMLPKVKLLIVGDGPSRKDLEAQAEELGIKNSVIFAGAKPWEQMGKFYQIGDVFATASTSETQGLTYIEAMAAKVPVVAKRDKSVEGIIVDGETGFTFEKDSDLPGLFYRVLTDKKLSKEIKENGYNAIADLSSKTFAERLEALYKEVLDTVY